MNTATLTPTSAPFSSPVQHALLLIDVQRGFMDHEDAALNELPVTGATVSARRAALFLRDMSSSIASVVATFDSHAAYGIERPGYWVNEKDTPLPAFTVVTADMVRAGTARAAAPESRPVAEHVIFKLASQSLMIWPVHCVLGTPGHALQEDVASQLAAWEVSRRRTAVRVLKGTHPDTEHYSALEAEVDLQTDNTSLDMSVPDALLQDHITGRIFVAGQASSHCVSATLRSLLRVAPELASRITLLTDCMNPVPGFERQEIEFFEWIEMHGGELKTTHDIVQSHFN
jgi:nicotinamidase/pyrazinamidase